MRSLVFVVMLMICIGGALSLSCPYCSKKACPPVKCRYGAGTDICGCCPKCLGGLGDECGGAWNNRGNCGDGFICKSKTHHLKGGHFGTYPNLPIGICTRKIVYE